MMERWLKMTEQLLEWQIWLMMTIEWLENEKSDLNSSVYQHLKSIIWESGGNSNVSFQYTTYFEFAILSFYNLVALNPTVLP